MCEEKTTLNEFGKSDELPSPERIETPIGEFPSNWAVERLSKICSINPDGFSEDDWPEDTFDYISLSDVSEGTILQTETTPIDEAPSRAQRRVQKGDILVGTVRPKQVSHGVVTEEHDGKICSSGFGVLRSPTNLNPLYLLQEVLSHQFFRQMEAYVAGSGYPAVKIGDLQKHRIAIPPLPEQRKIATVLYNVDQAIQKTEEIIEQTKRVKKGLMQDLFTKGYFEHDEFTKINSGFVNMEIPSNWKLQKFTKSFEIIDGDRGKNYPSSSDFMEDGYCLFLNAKNVTSEGFVFEETKFISQNKDKKMSKGKLERKDIVMTTRGTVGNIALFDDNVEYDNLRINSGMVIFRIKKVDYNVRFYYHLFNSDFFLKQINKISYGSAQPQTSVTEIKKLKILEFDNEEMDKISEILDDVDMEIKKGNKRKYQLKRLKKGLMQDLLTGKVRTHDKDIEVMDEIMEVEGSGF